MNAVIVLTTVGAAFDVTDLARTLVNEGDVLVAAE